MIEEYLTSYLALDFLYILRHRITSIFRLRTSLIMGNQGIEPVEGPNSPTHAKDDLDKPATEVVEDVMITVTKEEVR